MLLELSEGKNITRLNVTSKILTANFLITNLKRFYLKKY